MPGYYQAVVDFKRELLARSLNEHNGNKTRAARALGLQRTYFQKLLREHGIAAPPVYAWPRYHVTDAGHAALDRSA